MEQEKELGEKEFPEISFDEFEPTSYDTWKEETISGPQGRRFRKKYVYQDIRGDYVKADLHHVGIRKN